jgi:hypothetical protein
MNSNMRHRMRRYRLQLVLFPSALLLIVPLTMHFYHVFQMPNWILQVLVIYVSVATVFTIADFTEDIIAHRKSFGIIITFIFSLYLLPLFAVGLADQILHKASTPIGKLLLYVLGYSINIMYCLFNRDIVENNLSEFKAALYISAGLYTLILSILSIISVQYFNLANATRLAAIFASFTLCRGIIEIYSSKKTS